MKCISMVCAACLRGDRHVPVLAAYLFRSFDVCVSPAASAFNVPVVWVSVYVLCWRPNRMEYRPIQLALHRSQSRTGRHARGGMVG